MKSYQKAKSENFAVNYRNDPIAKVDFEVGDTIRTEKEGIGLVEGKIVAMNGQQLTCSWEHGTFYAWSWQSERVVR